MNDFVAGVHVYCATPTGIYETTDGAASWTLVPETRSFGAHTFRAGTIGGKPYILAGAAGGIANVPTIA